MALNTNNTITWASLIEKAKENLKKNIENLEGNSIPAEFIAGSHMSVKATNTWFNNRDHHPNGFNVSVDAVTDNTPFEIVKWSTVEKDFDDFLEYHNLRAVDRQDQLVTPRLVLNFLENVALFYTNRLVIACSSVGNKPKKLYYRKTDTPYGQWIGSVVDIDAIYKDIPLTAKEIEISLDSLDANLKNKAKAYTQTYTYAINCCSCSSSCSSCSSSSSSCCSCLTIVHQDLSML